MPAYHVENSITIAASPDRVHQALDDFNEWPVWSPWLYTEPDAKLSYRGEPGKPGHGYEWEGELTGAGSMELISNETSQMSMDLTFLKPFKSTAKVRFDLDASATTDETTVTWHLDSKLPFFMFFMTESIKSMIASDYGRGLKMLKEYVETGKVSSKTDMVGLVDVESLSCVGIRSATTMGELGESMGKTLPALHQHAESTNLTMEGPPLAIYNHINIKTSDCTYTAAIPVASVPENHHHELDDMVIFGEQIHACRALKVIHTGAYEHLGNSWSTAIAHQRAQKLKPSKVQAPFERYISDPADTAPDALITEIYLPIR